LPCLAVRGSYAIIRAVVHPPYFQQENQLICPLRVVARRKKGNDVVQPLSLGLSVGA
jgi:hypothetical protein